MKYISEERLETLLNNTSYITANDLLRVLINECIELNPLSDPEFKEYVANEEALAHDVGYAEGYNRGFEDGKHYSTWQPIDTAPKDRRILLLYEDGAIRVDWWHHESQQDNRIVAWTEIQETPK